MTEAKFNKERDRLAQSIRDASSLFDKIVAYSKFVEFMSTKSHNTHWNPKYARRFVVPKELSRLY